MVVFERTSRSEAETRAAGRELGARLRAGDVVRLSGTLGAGKTVFAKGLAEGLGLAPEGVSSPTFALVHDYGEGTRGLRFLHADLFRLRGLPGERPAIEDLGLEEARAEGAVLAVEWPGEASTGEDGYDVEIVALGEGARQLLVTSPPR